MRICGIHLSKTLEKDGVNSSDSNSGASVQMHTAYVGLNADCILSYGGF